MAAGALMVPIEASAAGQYIVQQQYSPRTDTELQGVWAVNPNTVFVVGEEPDCCTGGDITVTNDGGNNWNLKRQAVNFGDLNNVYAWNQTYAWAVGGSDGDTSPHPSLIRTGDGGNTWVQATTTNTTSGTSVADGFEATKHNIGQGGELGGVFFVSQTEGWAVGSTFTYSYPLGCEPGVDCTDAEVFNVLHTTDGGDHWTRQPVSGNKDSPPEHLDSVYMVSATEGWAVGNAGTILHTTDGASWTTMNTIDYKADYEQVTCVPKSSTQCYAVGEGVGGSPPGTIARWNGATWTVSTPGPEDDVYQGVAFPDSQHGWVVGRSTVSASLGVILTTSDGGTTWSRQDYPANLLGVSFADICHGWIVGKTGLILAYVDTCPAPAGAGAAPAGAGAAPAGAGAAPAAAAAAPKLPKAGLVEAGKQMPGLPLPGILGASTLLATGVALGRRRRRRARD